MNTDEHEHAHSGPKNYMHTQAALKTSLIQITKYQTKWILRQHKKNTHNKKFVRCYADTEILVHKPSEASPCMEMLISHRGIE